MATKFRVVCVSSGRAYEPTSSRGSNMKLYLGRTHAIDEGPYCSKVQAVVSLQSGCKKLRLSLQASGKKPLLYLGDGTIEPKEIITPDNILVNDGDSFKFFAQSIYVFKIMIDTAQAKKRQRAGATGQNKKKKKKIDNSELDDNAAGKFTLAMPLLPPSHFKVDPECMNKIAIECLSEFLKKHPEPEIRVLLVERAETTIFLSFRRAWLLHLQAEQQKLRSIATTATTDTATTTATATTLTTTTTTAADTSSSSSSAVSQQCQNQQEERFRIVTGNITRLHREKSNLFHHNEEEEATDVGLRARFLVCPSHDDFSPGPPTSVARSIHERAKNLDPDTLKRHGSEAVVGKCYVVPARKGSKLREKDHVEFVLHAICPNVNPAWPGAILPPSESIVTIDVDDDDAAQLAKMQPHERRLAQIQKSMALMSNRTIITNSNVKIIPEEEKLLRDCYTNTLETFYSLAFPSK